MKQNKDTIILLEKFMMAMDELVYQEEDAHSSMGLSKALGSIMINGIDFQIQVTLTPNKKNWLMDGELRFTPIIPKN